MQETLLIVLPIKNQVGKSFSQYELVYQFPLGTRQAFNHPAITTLENCLKYVHNSLVIALYSVLFFLHDDTIEGGASAATYAVGGRTRKQPGKPGNRGIEQSENKDYVTLFLDDGVPR